MEVCELLEHQVDCIVVTADVWMSIPTNSYLTVTAHYLDNKWTMNSIVLGTLPLLETHTGANLAEWIRNLVLDFGVDNGTNIDLAAKTLEAEQGWYSLGCAGHTLQCASMA